MYMYLMITKIHRNPEEMERNYHAVTDKDFLCHFRGKKKPYLIAQGK